MDEKVLEVCFQIITYVGTAKSMYIDAIQLAKQGEFEQAKDCLLYTSVVNPQKVSQTF